MSRIKDYWFVIIKSVREHTFVFLTFLSIVTKQFYNCSSLNASPWGGSLIRSNSLHERLGHFKYKQPGFLSH